MKAKRITDKTKAPKASERGEVVVKSVILYIGNKKICDLKSYDFKPKI